MTNQAMQPPPMPRLPPILGPDGRPDGKRMHELNLEAAQILVKLRETAFDVMFRTVSGFFEQPDQQRVAFYLTHEPLMQWFTQPNQIQSGEIDPATGQPAPPVNAPPLMQLNQTLCEKMAADAATLYERYGVQPQMMPLEAPI